MFQFISSVMMNFLFNIVINKLYKKYIVNLDIFSYK